MEHFYTNLDELIFADLDEVGSAARTISTEE